MFDFNMVPIFHLRYEEDGLDVDLYENFLTFPEATQCFQYFEQSVQWTRTATSHNRVNRTYGHPGSVYRVKFQNNIIDRQALEWDPVISALRSRVTKLTGQESTFCVVMRYGSGNAGINPHRDKEMRPGSSIIGLSIGETRILTLTRGDRKIHLKLSPGSLYVMNPPTNDKWAHSIEKDGTIHPRISLTFRDYSS